MSRLTLRQLQALSFLGRSGPLSLEAFSERFSDHVPTTATTTRDHLATLECRRLVRTTREGAFHLTSAGFEALEDAGFHVPAHQRRSRPATSQHPPTGTGACLRELPTATIDPSPWQVRRFRDDGSDLVELAASIRAHGIIQPILVRPRGSRYELIIGERRLRACRLLGLETVLALVRDLSDHVARDLALVHHLHQRDLRPLEESHAVDLLTEDNGPDPFQILFRTGRGGPWIGRRLSLRRLVDEWQNALGDPHAHFRDLSPSHLERIAQLPDDLQRRLLRADEFSDLWWQTDRTDPAPTRTPRLPTLAQLDQAIEHAKASPTPTT